MTSTSVDQELNIEALSNDLSGADYDLHIVIRRLLSFAGRIQGHVRAAPASADAALPRQLFELGVGCQ